MRTDAVMLIWPHQAKCTSAADCRQRWQRISVDGVDHLVAAVGREAAAAERTVAEVQQWLHLHVRGAHAAGQKQTDGSSLGSVGVGELIVSLAACALDHDQQHAEQRQSPVRAVRRRLKP